MTAKDKSKQLTGAFFDVNTNDIQYEWLKAKKQALICVDEILIFIEQSDPQALSYEMFGYRDYFREVKNEINKL